LTEYKVYLNLIVLMQIADVVIEDINVLWLLMYICILDQDQDSLIVFFKLNE